MLILTTGEIGLAFLGSVGFLSISLLYIKLIKYFIGIGAFGFFFLLAYLLLEDLNASVFIATFMGVLLGTFYEYHFKYNGVSIILVVLLAIIGFIIIGIVLINYFKYSSIAINGIPSIKQTQSTFRTLNQLQRLLK